MTQLERRAFLASNKNARRLASDFAPVVGAVARVLARHPHAQLSVTGPLNFHVPARPGQVMHHAPLPFCQCRHIMQGARVNLAPLEASPFTPCKSALKVIEAAWWNIPTMCSPLPDAERLRGVGAFTALAPNFEAQLEASDALQAEACADAAGSVA